MLHTVIIILELLLGFIIGMLIGYILILLFHWYNAMQCWKEIKPLWIRIRVFHRIEKRLLGKVVYKFYNIGLVFKLIFLPFIGKNQIIENHKYKSKHHITLNKSPHKVDYIAGVIDLECTRLITYQNSITTKMYYVMISDSLGVLHYANLVRTAKMLGIKMNK